MIPLLTAGVPWALMMTWLISSPLNSPNTFFLITGALGYPMAIAQIVAAIAMGVGSGWLTSLLERKGYLKGQIHSAEPKKPDLSGNPFPMVKEDPWPLKGAAAETGIKGVWKVFCQTLFKSGTRKLLKQLALFVLVASAIKILVPTSWITTLFGQNHWYSIPFAALLGIPLYVSNASSIPIAKTLVEGGMSSGAALAFLLSGAGTSLPAISGLLVITRGRIVALYVTFIFIGALVFGALYSLIYP